MGLGVVNSNVSKGTSKREAILDAALHLFAERGFHGTAVPLVAKRAQVGAGTVYRYFDSKEALVNVLYREWKVRLSDAVLHEFPFDQTFREQLHVYWTRTVEFAVKYPKSFDFLELHKSTEIIISVFPFFIRY